MHSEQGLGVNNEWGMGEFGKSFGVGFVELVGWVEFWSVVGELVGWVEF